MSEVNNNTEKNKAPEYKIRMIDSADFDPVIEISTKTTKRLSVAINQMFQGAFKDYVGCHLSVVPMQMNGSMIYTTVARLVFKVLPIDQYDWTKFHYAFKQDNIKEASMVEKIARITTPQQNYNKFVSITDDGKSALIDFIWHYMKKDKMKWSDHYQVKIIQDGTPNGACYISFNSVDPIALVKRIYGMYDPEGNPYEYALKPVKPVSVTDTKSGLYNWLIQIERATPGSAERAAADVGLMTTLGQQLQIYSINQN